MMNKERDATIVNDYLSGKSPREIAEQFGLSRTRIWQIVLAAGALRSHSEAFKLLYARGLILTPTRKDSNPERSAQVARLLDRGFTYSEIAERVGVSRNTVAGLVFRRKRRARSAATIREAA